MLKFNIVGCIGDQTWDEASSNILPLSWTLLYSPHPKSLKCTRHITLSSPNAQKTFQTSGLSTVARLSSLQYFLAKRHWHTNLFLLLTCMFKV